LVEIPRIDAVVELLGSIRLDSQPFYLKGLEDMNLSSQSSAGLGIIEKRKKISTFGKTPT